MAKKDCPPDAKWDQLIVKCIPNRPLKETSPQPTTAAVVHLRARTPAALADPVAILSPALWITVGLVTMGSIVALVLWSIIYRQQRRHSNPTGGSEPGQEPLAKKMYPPPLERNGPVMLQRAMEAPVCCPHLDVGVQTGSRWEEGFTTCRGPANYGGLECGGDRVTCNTMREHRIPLPATELGGTALVTTKTV